MSNILPLHYQDDIRLALSQHTFSINIFVARLIADGYNEAEAHRLVYAEYKAYKTALFTQKMKQNEQEEARKIAFAVVFVVSVIGPAFHIGSALWYLISFLVAGGAGYYGYQSKPVAGIAGAIMLAIVYPFAHHYYFSGRSSYITIELLIPMAMAAVPALLLFLVLSRTLYANPDNL